MFLKFYLIKTVWTYVNFFLLNFDSFVNNNSYIPTKLGEEQFKVSNLVIEKIWAFYKQKITADAWQNNETKVKQCNSTIEWNLYIYSSASKDSKHIYIYYAKYLY